MSDDYFDEGRTANLTYWGLGQMMKGAGMAAVFVIGIGVLLGIVWVIGQLLPAASKENPSPYGALEQRVLPADHDLA